MSAVEIVMPRLSDAMEQGTIVRWLKQVGDQVDVGDELVEVETDKATVIYEAEVSGLLSAILVREGEAQQLGGPIARLGGDPEPENEATAVASEPEAAPVSAPASAQAAAPTHANGSGRPLATPVARSRARELGVDLTRLTGTGPRGRIRLADVESAAAAPAQTGVTPRIRPPRRPRPFSMRRDAAAASSCR